jgi:hypothetical protein
LFVLTNLAPCVYDRLLPSAQIDALMVGKMAG